MTKNRSKWVSIAVIVMLLALIGFSGLPLVNTIIQSTRSSNDVVALNGDRQQLEGEAKGYQTVLEREPDNINALKGLLTVRLKQGNLQEAIAPLEKLAKLKPNETDYTILLAQAKQQVKDYQGAENDYRQLLTLHPENTLALQGIVNLLLELKRPEDAINLVTNNLNTTKRSDVSETNSVELILGQIYSYQKKYEEAISIYNRAFEANKEDFRPLLAKGLVLQQQGKNTEAKSVFETAANLAPTDYKERIQELIEANNRS
jgi:tetratricopeptide (TPR) repeat protein